MPAAPIRLPVPEAVVLDLDGTLVDTVETRIRAWLAVFAEFDIPATRAQVAPLIGSDGRWLARRVASDAELDLPSNRDEDIDRRSGEIYESLNRDPQPLPGARELLLELGRRGRRWAIATSSRREQVKTSVDALRLPQQPTIVDGAHVEHAKPAPDLLLLAARELEVQPGAAWYVGDSTWDMRSAQAAGMMPVGVLAGSVVDAGELRQAGAAAVVRTLEELLPLLG